MTEPISRSDLLQFFHSGAKPAAGRKIGIEYELLGIQRKTGEPLSFFGAGGIQEILKYFSILFEWKKVYENKNIIGLEREQASIALEPGGQLEFSSSAWSTLAELEKELQGYLRELQRISEPRGVEWLALGIHPEAPLKKIPWVPKGRYEIMSRYLAGKGVLSHRMMKQTASVQVNLDYENERDAMRKLRLLMAMAPVLTALFANSSRCEGKQTGYASYRAHVWQQTDPQRCGLIENVFSPDYSFEEYLDRCLSVPMMFLEREGKWIPVEGISFADYLRSGWKEFSATLEDWELHLSTLFPEVRLKQVLELRSVDSQPAPRAMSVAALVAGILYCASSMDAAWDLFKDWSREERERVYGEVPKYGLRTRVKNVTMSLIADELVALARKGLRENEQRWLDPVYGERTRQ